MSGYRCRRPMRRLVQMLTRNIDRHVMHIGSQTVEQQPRLQAAPTAVFDENDRFPDDADNLVDALPHDSKFGARQVILGKFANFLEKLRSDAVIKIFARQSFRRSGQPAEHVRQKIGIGGRVRRTKIRRSLHKSITFTLGRVATAAKRRLRSGCRRCGMVIGSSSIDRIMRRGRFYPAWTVLRRLLPARRTVPTVRWASNR